MDCKEAIEVIKKNWPDSKYTMLREALELAIKALKKQSSEYTKQLENHLLKIEDFEADVLKNDIVWETHDGLPHLTYDEYNRWLELQDERNKLLNSVIINRSSIEEIAVKSMEEVK